MSHNPHGLVLPPHLDPRGNPGTPRRRRIARVLSWIAVVTSVLVLVASGVGYALFRFYDGNIDRVPFAPGGDRPARAGGKALNFLLIGSDSREGAGKEELKRFATEFTPGRRSDTMILLHLSADRKHVTAISFPRDAWVAIPVHGNRPAHMGKINTAFSIGGRNLAAQTVEQLTGLRIDHYIEVNFAGFQRLVDALDGVEVCLTRPAREPLSGIDLPAGRQTIRGTQALSFVRQREQVPGGDLGRIRRQQHFMGAMLRKATGKGILLNPARLLRFLDVATESVQIDDRLGYADLKDLALAMRGLDPKRVMFATAPVDRLARRNGQSVVLLDEAELAETFAAVRADRPIGSPPPASPGPGGGGQPLTVAPANIRVTVLNGTDIPRHAARAAEDLRRLGFRISGTGNSPAVEATVVRHPAARADSARTVTAAIPGARLEVDPGASGVTVVLGRDYRGARAVTVRPSRPAAPPGPAASASANPAAPTTAAEAGCIA